MPSKIYFQDKYKEGYSYPDMEGISESEKQKPKYNRNVAEWFYHLYCKGATELNKDYLTLIDELRDYARGKQSPDKYKSYFSGKKSTTTSETDSTADTNQYHRKGWMNVDWDNPPSFIPTLIDAIQGTLADNDYDIKADPIDYDSGYEEDLLMTQAYVDGVWGKLFNQMSQIAGLPIKEENPVISFDELEEMKKEGTFKAPYIREHEKLLLHTENISKWDSISRQKHIEDLVAIGYTFEHAIYDKATSKVKWEYVNARNMISQYSTQHDFGDSDFMGFLRWKTISELRACTDYISDGDKNGITEKELRDIAGTYKNIYNNPDFTNSFYSTDKEKNVNIDDFKVLEFVLYWRDVDNKKEIEYTNKYGKKRLYPYNNSVKRLSDREKIKKMRTRRLYSCTWIVGTNYVYDYGLFPNQPYESNNPWIPIRGVKLDAKSLVHRLLPVEDQFAESWFKMVNGFAKASEGGFAIDVTRLAMNDPKKFNPLGVVKAWREDNIFFYQSSANGLNVGGTPVPINLIPGNLRELVEPHMNHLSWCVSFAENLTGIPLIMLGATPKQDALVGVQEMSIQSATNSLRKIVDRIRALKEDLAEGSSQMIQLAIKYDERARFEYSKVIGENSVTFLYDATYLPIEYGITMKARPTLMERQSILKAADEALLNGRNGQPGITLDQNIYIKEQIFAGANIGELRLTLKKWIQKDTILKQQQKERDIMLQGQQIQQQVEKQGQVQQQIEAMRIKGMQIDYDLKTRSQMMIDNNKSIRNIDETIVEVLAKLYGEAGVYKAQQLIDNEQEQQTQQ